MQMKLAFRLDILKQVISVDEEHTWFFFSVFIALTLMMTKSRRVMVRMQV